MEKYNFDWEKTIAGTIEIEAKNGEEAEQQLKKLSVNDLINNSKYLSGDENLRIRFVDIEGDIMDSMDVKEWDKLKSHI